jgi:uncharacterized membrane protein YphA (DoxX/SURF4 family)
MLMTIGRVLFALLFIVTGALQLLNLGETANEVAAKVTMPELLSPLVTLVSPYTDQLLAATNMSMAQLLAMSAAVLQIVCGLMIAFNLGARFFAAVLVLFVIATTLFVHDFWNQTVARDRNESIFHILKNIALIGGLFMIIGYRPQPQVPTAEPIYHDRVAL